MTGVTPLWGGGGSPAPPRVGGGSIPHHTTKPHHTTPHHTTPHHTTPHHTNSHTLNPYDLLQRPESTSRAVWREALVVDEAVERLVALDALLVFEVRAGGAGGEGGAGGAGLHGGVLIRGGRGIRVKNECRVCG